MDLTRLTVGERIVVSSGIALVVCSFLPWFGPGRLVSGATRNGWTFPLFGVMPVQLAAILVLVVLARRLADAPLLDLGPKLRWGDISLAVAVVVCALVLAKIIGGDRHLGATSSREYGLILAGVASVGLLIGGFISMREDRPKPAGDPDASNDEAPDESGH